MRKALVEKMQCPKCGGRKFSVAATKEDGEIRKGSVTCLGCSAKYGIEDGIVELILDIGNLKSEVEGWGAMSKDEGWHQVSDEYLLELPRPKKSSEGLQWERHAGNYFFMLEKLKPLAGKQVLDLGAGRCWSSRYLAKEGADVVAVDIVKERSAGLLASEVFMRNDKTFFERVVADMNNLPFRDGSFDIVFFSGALHHTNDLFKTLSEAARVLKRGGVIAMTNESCGGLLTDELIGKQTKYGINEHTYKYTRYMSYLGKLGFKTKVFNEHDFYRQGKARQILMLLPQEIRRYARAGVLVAISKKG